jgi:NAD(P)-dependent dehydrogenase (short-subunit alcohol dehydrogenase family)
MTAGRLADKVALVAGAGSGIGRATALRFAQEGAVVVVTSRTLGHAEATSLEIKRATGRDTDAVALDVTDGDDLARVISDAVRRNGPIDIVSNNAGVDDPDEPPIAEMSDATWDDTMLVNATGAFRLSRAVVPAMSDGGSIVHMASRDALIARKNAAAYCASKAALLQLTRCLALELAPRRIRANCVCPGVVDTPLVDLFLARSSDPDGLRREYAASNAFRRLADPREIADCVVFLASDEATFVTGTALVADGGALSW